MPAPMAPPTTRPIRACSPRLGPEVVEARTTSSRFTETLEPFSLIVSSSSVTVTNFLRGASSWIRSLRLPGRPSGDLGWTRSPVASDHRARRQVVGKARESLQLFAWCPPDVLSRNFRFQVFPEFHF